MMEDGRSQRRRERLGLQLPIRVSCRESVDYEWTELTRLIDVTPFGARFTLARPTEAGRLLHLTLPLPRQLRCFDHTEEQYRVWTIVRNMKMIPASVPLRFEVGVAFVGKRPPASYADDPGRRYEIGSALETGLLGLRDLPQQGRPPVAPTEPRPSTRLQMAIEMRVEVFNDKGEVIAQEQTVTENISRRGASVFTTLSVERGRFVRLTDMQYNISVIAAVRVRRTGTDGIPRLHLEFIDKQWPLEGVE